MKPVPLMGNQEYAPAEARCALPHAHCRTRQAAHPYTQKKDDESKTNRQTIGNVICKCVLKRIRIKLCSRKDSDHGRLYKQELPDRQGYKEEECQKKKTLSVPNKSRLPSVTSEGKFRIYAPKLNECLMNGVSWLKISHRPFFS